MQATGLGRSTLYRLVASGAFLPRAGPCGAARGGLALGRPRSLERVAPDRTPIDGLLWRSAPGPGRAQPGASEPLTRCVALPRSRARAGDS